MHCWSLQRSPRPPGWWGGLRKDIIRSRPSALNFGPWPRIWSLGSQECTPKSNSCLYTLSLVRSKQTSDILKLLISSLLRLCLVLLLFIFRWAAFVTAFNRLTLICRFSLVFSERSVSSANDKWFSLYSTDPKWYSSQDKHMLLSLIVLSLLCWLFDALQPLQQ